jgi:hypothetical protein
MTSAALECEGVLVSENVLPHETIGRLLPHFDAIQSDHAGSRGFELGDDVIELISGRGPLGMLADQSAGRAARPVRVLFFDKTTSVNWAVPWHQDRTVAVKQRVDMAGFGPWSIKDGVTHVEPPVAILEHMLTLRVFVDDCGEDNGPLEVVKGSHRFGRLASKP